MRKRMLAAVCGIQLVGYWPALIPWHWILLPALLMLLAERVLGQGFLGRRAGAGARCCKWLTGDAARLAEVLGVTAFLLLGLSWHLIRAEQLLMQRLPAQLEGQDLVVSGTVVSLPEARLTGQRFQLRVESGPPELVQRKLLLNHYGQSFSTEDSGSCTSNSGNIRANQRWQFTVRLQQPHGFANPGTFDYEAWLFQQRLSARGYVRASTANRCLGSGDRWLLGARSALRQRLLSASAGLPFQSVILALTLGDRSALSDQQWDRFSATGTNHLVVISGLHVALLAGLAAALTACAWRRSVRLTRLFPVQQAAACVAIAAALLYSLLAGFALPTQRALVMVAVFMSSRLLGVNCGPLTSLLLALLAVAAMDPLAATAAGFWLSFTAVAALLLVFTGVPAVAAARGGLSWRALLLPQLVVFVGLLVPLGFWLGQVSLVAPLTNVIAIPVVSWLVVPLCLAGAVVSLVSETGAMQLLSLANLVFDWLYRLLGGLMTIPELLPGFAATMAITPGSGLLLICAAVGSALLILPGAGSLRGLALLMLLPWLWPPATKSTENLLEMYVLDVGQGLSVIVRTGNATLVYDTGPRFASGFDSGEAIVAPVLRGLGVRWVDRLLISHADNDHAGGVSGLLASMPIDDIVSGEPLDVPEAAVDYCGRGQSWEWNEVKFEIIYPFTPVEGNNGSCVLLISAGEFRLLLPGDIEGVAERLLLGADSTVPKLDVLVSAHHGSNTSSSAAFVARTMPSLVIHSAGYRNQFGHPAAKVRQRFARHGSVQMLTAEQGMISVVIKAHRQDLEVRTYRSARRRYWHWSENP